MKTKNYGAVVTIYEIINENSYITRSSSTSTSIRYFKVARNMVKLINHSSKYTEPTKRITPAYHCIVYNTRFRNVFIYTDY